MRKILITNDDGIEADGIKRLIKVASKFGEVWVVAPESQRSAMSHSITLRLPFEAYPYEFDDSTLNNPVHAYACTGTPADCVRVGVLNIVPGKPDVIFSGINFGYNSATDLQYSATAGAAFEGCFQGVRSIAFSEGFSEKHPVTDFYIEQIIKNLIDKDPGQDCIWNVNFPDIPLTDCKGILENRTVSRDSFYHDRYKQENLEGGRMRFMVDGIYNENAEIGTDMRAIVDGFVSIGIVHNLS